MHTRFPNRIGISYNPKTSMYEIAEDGITYAMPFVQMHALKAFFWQYYGRLHGDVRTVAEWYRLLEKEDKKRVQRSGAVPENDTGFRADVDWPD